MRKELFLVILFVVVAYGCSSPTMATLKEFPLEKGTTWVYAYQAYEPSASDPTQIIKVKYQLTETVADTQFSSPYFVAHIKSDWELIQADSNWTDDFISNQPSETWTIVNGQQVFGSGQAVGIKNINTNDLLLDYDFPLIVNKSWCPMKIDLKDPTQKIANCQFSGVREITGKGIYETAAGKFNDCYNIVDQANDGDVFQEFCNGVGMVSLKYDHGGTLFGFEQTLTHFSAGVP